jgi:hypothetical protein
VTVLVSDGDDNTGAEEDDYMITVDTWKDLPKSLRGMVKNLIKKGNYTEVMVFRRRGMTITSGTPNDFAYQAQ